MRLLDRDCKIDSTRNQRPKAYTLQPKPNTRHCLRFRQLGLGCSSILKETSALSNSELESFQAESGAEDLHPKTYTQHPSFLSESYHCDKGTTKLSPITLP